MAKRFNIVDYGAVIDNSTDDTVAWRAAVAAASVGGGVVYHPGGDVPSVITDTVTIAAEGVFLEGEGVEASAVRFAPTLAGITCFLFEGSGQLLCCGMSGLHMQSGSSPFAKIGVDIHDCDGFLWKNCRIKAWTGSTDTDAIAVRIRGRGPLTFEQMWIEAGLPIQFDLNSDRDALKDLDSAVFRDCYLQSKVAPNPVIQVVPNSGWIGHQVYFEGRQNWIHGGFEWIDTTVPRTLDKRDFLSFANLRAEQISSPTSDTRVIRIELSQADPLEELRVMFSELTGPNATCGGVRAYGVSNIVVDQSRHRGSQAALEHDSTANVGIYNSPTLLSASVSTGPVNLSHRGR